jgi:hypothetical protein
VKNILQRAILISLLAFVMSSRAYAAEGTAQEFLDRYEHADVTERQTLLVLIKGLEDGVSWANASNQAHGVARLYCPPGKIFYQQPEDLIDMLRREVEARPDIGREPWQLATIETLRRVFPCKRPKRSSSAADLMTVGRALELALFLNANTGRVEVPANPTILLMIRSAI